MYSIKKVLDGVVTSKWARENRRSILISCACYTLSKGKLVGLRKLAPLNPGDYYIIQRNAGHRFDLIAFKLAALASEQNPKDRASIFQRYRLDKSSEYISRAKAVRAAAKAYLNAQGDIKIPTIREMLRAGQEIVEQPRVSRHIRGMAYRKLRVFADTSGQSLEDMRQELTEAAALAVYRILPDARPEAYLINAVNRSVSNRVCHMIDYFCAAGRQEIVREEDGSYTRTRRSFSDAEYENGCSAHDTPEPDTSIFRDPEMTLTLAGLTRLPPVSSRIARILCLEDDQDFLEHAGASSTRELLESTDYSMFMEVVRTFTGLHPAQFQEFLSTLVLRGSRIQIPQNRLAQTALA